MQLPKFLLPMMTRTDLSLLLLSYPRRRRLYLLFLLHMKTQSNKSIIQNQTRLYPNPQLTHHFESLFIYLRHRYGHRWRQKQRPKCKETNFNNEVLKHSQEI
ncbi:hypothetical protein CIPAW_07G108600 [Carya illinoinensis]|uniref:Uncharacterized protein n=1 Tax=Carya illinoinensis TaxID=32201 RepID=A0A8T1Q090_CARIL|nr:hypothetical protein CIPAW_07G108600 [Carya illinoinensis]